VYIVCEYALAIERDGFVTLYMVGVSTEFDSVNSSTLAVTRYLLGELSSTTIYTLSSMSNQLVDLPSEVLVHIFSNLTINERLVLIRVSRALQFTSSS
jgi:hypothetical protein